MRGARVGKKNTKMHSTDTGQVGSNGEDNSTHGLRMKDLAELERRISAALTRIGDGELGSISSTNNTINVGKDKDDIVITCKADGYDDKTTRLVSSVSTAGVVGGAFLDLGITDMITGAMYEYQTDINVALDKTKPLASADQAQTSAAK